MSEDEMGTIEGFIGGLCFSALVGGLIFYMGTCVGQVSTKVIYKVTPAGALLATDGTACRVYRATKWEFFRDTTGLLAVGDSLTCRWD